MWRGVSRIDPFLSGATMAYAGWLETGKVIEFVSDEIERLQHEIADEHGYEIEDHSLVIYVRPKKS